jgi:hypothetical protein
VENVRIYLTEAVKNLGALEGCFSSLKEVNLLEIQIQPDDNTWREKNSGFQCFWKAVPNGKKDHREM